MSYLTETEQDAGIANFGIYRRIVVNTILQMKESRKYFPTMIRWAGYKSVDIEVKHAKRKKGKSSYNFKKSFDLALSVMVSFSDKPLKIVTKLGFILAFSSFVVALFYFYIALKGRIEVTGWASLIISLWFLSGLIIFILGIIGIYISKIFDEVKRRPIYAVKDIINDSENGMGN